MSRRISAQFFDAVNARDVATVRSLLASGRLSSDVLVDASGTSAVALAVKLGDAALLQALIDAKADVDASVFPPPVRIAVTNVRVDLLRMLLRAGARPCR
jgi:ankyrin repeat protein